jgi:hypothetical protein
MRAATVRTIALGLPDTEERETWGEATFRVRNKIFLMLDPDGKRAAVKSTHDEQAALLAQDPETFFRPEYVGVHGWIGVVVARADREEVRELIVEAWRLTAPRRLVRSFDEEHG